MANPRIDVEIGAVIDGLKKGFGDSVKIIETLERQALELDKALKAATDLPEIQSLNAKLAQTKAALTQLKTAGVEPLAKATSGYNSIGTDFARIIQDAPFGIIGVGNNIQQLAGSFQTLKNQTGSTSGALKQAFASIFSSGNALVLGISLLTSAFTVLQMNGFFKSEKAAKSLSDQLEDYRKTLDAVTRTSIEGQANAAKEIQSFSLLRAQAENTNASLKDRKAAVDSLQKQYPEYLKGLTDEQILTGQVGNAYNELTKGLIATAKARAASDQIAKNSLDTLTILTQEEDRAFKILQEREKLESIVANKGKTTGQDLLALKNQEAIQQNKINSLINEQLESAGKRNKIEDENAKLIGAINSQVSQGANFVKDSGKAIDTTKDKLKEYGKAWDDFNLQQELARDFQDKLTLSTKDYEKQINGVVKAIADFSSAGPVNVKIKTEIEGFEEENAGARPFDVFLDDVAFQLDKLPDLQQRVAEFAFTVNDLLKNNVTNAFIDLGYTIGETLASGGNVLKAIGGSVLKSFSNFLGQFGQQLIAYGVAASAFGKVSLALATPGAAIIAAPLAIAAGIALTAIAGAIGSLGKKGTGGGGGGGGAGGGSAAQAGSTFTGGGVGGLFAQNRDVSGEFVVKGQDLVYVLGQANNRINKG
jgi:hypothetical protein